MQQHNGCSYSIARQARVDHARVPRSRAPRVLVYLIAIYRVPRRLAPSWLPVPKPSRPTGGLKGCSRSAWAIISNVQTRAAMPRGSSSRRPSHAVASGCARQSPFPSGLSASLPSQPLCLASVLVWSCPCLYQFRNTLPSRQPPKSPKPRAPFLGLPATSNAFVRTLPTLYASDS